MPREVEKVDEVHAPRQEYIIYVSIVYIYCRVRTFNALREPPYQASDASWRSLI